MLKDYVPVWIQGGGTSKGVSLLKVFEPVKARGPLLKYCDVPASLTHVYAHVGL